MGRIFNTVESNCGQKSSESTETMTAAGNLPQEEIFNLLALGYYQNTIDIPMVESCLFYHRIGIKWRKYFVNLSVL
jgi:hypothetical protein